MVELFEFLGELWQAAQKMRSVPIAALTEPARSFTGNAPLNPTMLGGVLLDERDGSMPEYAMLSGALLNVEDDLEREFEAHLVESSTLAFRVAFGVLRRHEDAEDVAQEAFTKAYKSFRQLRDRRRFRAWLVRMTWRLAVNRQRSDRRRASREAVPVKPSPEATTAETLIARERTQQLWAAIDTLPEKLRVVTVLAGIEGHDIREVALLLGLPEGTVKSRLFLGRQRLKESLQWAHADPTAR